MLNSASAHISIMTGARGPNLALATACATGTHALGEAAEMIRRGHADLMIAGGSEAAIVEMAVAAFENMHALSGRNDEPERASRPFDKERDGFVVAEGAGVVVLERLDRARARGVHIYGEIIGYGITADAYHITAPSENGVGAAECMQMALEEAGIDPSEVDYINAHGTSTPLNDASETLSIKAVFGADAYRVAISSTKSMTGHLMGSAGAIEAACCLLAMRDNILPRPSTTKRRIPCATSTTCPISRGTRPSMWPCRIPSVSAGTTARSSSDGSHDGRERVRRKSPGAVRTDHRLGQLCA